MSDLLSIGGVGPKKVEALELAEIFNLRDLIYYTPYRYEDRTVFRQFDDLEIGEKAHLIGEIIDVYLHAYEKPRLTADVLIKGGTIQVVYFTAISFWQRHLKIGQRIKIWGKVQYHIQYQIVHPQLDFLTKKEKPIGEVLPIYRLNQKMGQCKIEHRFLQKIILAVLKTYSFQEAISEELRRHLGLSEEFKMLKSLHNPKTISDAIKAQDELFIRHWFPICLDLEKEKKNRLHLGWSFSKSIHYKPSVISSLPFELTEDQLNAITQIEKGLESSNQYHGLLNGDVGSGKTIVAFLSTLSVIENRKQVVLMVPTEILAQQHFKTFQSFLKDTDICCCLLTGYIKKRDRESIKKKLLKGSIQLIVGTQAVFSSDIQYCDLGYVILDEQQRYGVEQKKKLFSKGNYPDILQMTATPIPQSLVQIFYEDMDHIVISKAPNFRKERKTRLVPIEKRKDLLQFLKIKSKNQEPFFWVLPRIESTGSGNVEAPLPTVIDVYSELKMIDKNWKVVPFHSKIEVEEQIQILKDLQDYKIQGLVATTVIEVGVDLPLVNLMIIESPERFGLSQLHQLRGRVGRGDKESWCFLLLSDHLTSEQLERLEQYSKLNDGFKIAELDLEIRGPGQLQGNIQSGFKDFKEMSVKKQMQRIKFLRDKAKSWIKILKIN